MSAIWKWLWRCAYEMAVFVLFSAHAPHAGINHVSLSSLSSLCALRCVCVPNGHLLSSVRHKTVLDGAWALCVFRGPPNQMKYVLWSSTHTRRYEWVRTMYMLYYCLSNRMKLSFRLLFLFLFAKMLFVTYGWPIMQHWIWTGTKNEKFSMVKRDAIERSIDHSTDRCSVYSQYYPGARWSN